MNVDITKLEFWSAYKAENYIVTYSTSKKKKRISDFVLKIFLRVEG